MVYFLVPRSRDTPDQRFIYSDVMFLIGGSVV
jgi:hypothetical protein